jgi:TPR repeat protein
VQYRQERQTAVLSSPLPEFPMMLKYIKKIFTGTKKSDYELGTEAAMGENYPLALKYFLKAAETGDAKSGFLAGFFYEKGIAGKKDLNAALHLYEKAAQQGYTDALYRLANLYKKSKETKHIRKAESLLALAAEKGHPDAAFSIAMNYKTGRNLRKNDREAFRLFLVAAEKGHMKAQYNLGVMCAGGRGTPKNDEEAVRWYRMSADQGYAIAQYNLAYMLQSGRGAEKNFKEALFWFNKAKRQL